MKTVDERHLDEEADEGPVILPLGTPARDLLAAAYDAHYVPLVRLATVLLGPTSPAYDAERVVQDAFVATPSPWPDDALLSAVLTDLGPAVPGGLLVLPGLLDLSDQRLAEALAVPEDEVEAAVGALRPAPALDAIRLRLARVAPRRSRTAPVVAAAVLLAALGVVVLAARETTPPAPAPAPLPIAFPSSATVNGTAYFVGRTPGGPRLFAETRDYPRPAATSDLQALVTAVVDGTTGDPQLRSAFPRGTRVLVFRDDTGVQIDLAGNLAALRAEPADGSGHAGVQALVLTVGEALHERAHVRLTLAGAPADRVLGERIDPARTFADDAAVAPVLVTTPADSTTVARRFAVAGDTAAFGADLRWELRDGARVVRHGSTRSGPCCTRGGFGFTVTRAPIGRYTLVVGSGAGRDTKRLIIVGGGTNGNGR